MTALSHIDCLEGSPHISMVGDNNTKEIVQQYGSSLLIERTNGTMALKKSGCFFRRCGYVNPSWSLLGRPEGLAVHMRCSTALAKLRAHNPEA